MTSKSKLAALAILVLTSALPANADSSRKEVIRTEYNQTIDTPDHLVFASTLRYIKNRHDIDDVVALEIVERRMKFKSIDYAEEFLETMLEAANELAAANLNKERTMLCNPSLGRRKSDIYLMMDALDDARICSMVIIKNSSRN